MPLRRRRGAWEGALNKRLDPSRAGRDAVRLADGLRSLVAGQDEAIRQIVDLYQVYLAGLTAARRPVGTLLFLGPTGCGKTRIVEAAAQCLLGNERAVLKIDCGEFQHSHQIAKLVGSPPGYLGHRETAPLLSQEALERHRTGKLKMSVILFDEIEKASDALWNLLLGVMDRAALTLGNNRKVDFSRAMIFMTSNLGGTAIEALSHSRFGFACPARVNACGMRDEWSKIWRTGIDEAQRQFTPEFMNRLDKIVVFKPLGTAELRRVLEIELKMVQQRVLTAAGRRFVFTVTEAGKRYLLHEGTDIRYGARHLKRAIERLVVQPMAKLIASGQIRGGDRIRIHHLSGSPALTFERLMDVPGTDPALRLDRGELDTVSAPNTHPGLVPVLHPGFGSLRYLSE